jgi:hypothetical protein
VPVAVFSRPEALEFLAERTGLADAEDARAVAAGLGYPPLALAQAAACLLMGPCTGLTGRCRKRLLMT